MLLFLTVHSFNRCFFVYHEWINSCYNAETGLMKSKTQIYYNAWHLKGESVTGNAVTRVSGGETAEMPGTYNLGEFEVSGFVVGAVERGQYLPQTSHIAASDVVIGLPSSGLHSNGFSLVRAVIDQHSLTYEDASPFESDRTLGNSHCSVY